jgi:hypothetical protein
MRIQLFLPLAFGLSLIATPTFAWGNTERIGIHGHHGQEGRSGRSGSSGETQTIFANGSPMNLDLSGQAGEDGDDGQAGDSARCVDQYGNAHEYQPEHDLRGANGGNGGNGGSGGYGGNGGDLTLYYNNPNDLRNILVRSSGGRGGRGGRGAYGGIGCYCPRPRWEVKTCTGSGTEQKCQVRHYTCENGRNGTNGNYGSDGGSGSMGRLTLIQYPTALPGEQPSQGSTMANWQRSPMSLSRNYWVSRTGAVQRLGIGSVVADAYTELDSREERSLKLVWQAKLPLGQFSNAPVSARINDEKMVSLNLDNNLWTKSTWSQSGNEVTYTVNEAIHRKDALNLGIAGIRGSGNKLTVKMLDRSMQSNNVSTSKITVRYTVKEGIDRWREVYHGEIGAELFDYRSNEFVIALGKVPIAPEELAAGKTIGIEIQATRNFGTYSDIQKMGWQGTIGALPAK